MKQEVKRIEKPSTVKPKILSQDRNKKGIVVVVDKKEEIIRTNDLKLPFLHNMDCYVRKRADGSYFLFILNIRILNIKQIHRKNALWFFNRKATSVGRRGGKKCQVQSCEDYAIYHLGPQVRKDLFMSNMKV
jgi:hypothetical protein